MPFSSPFSAMRHLIVWTFAIACLDCFSVHGTHTQLHHASSNLAGAAASEALSIKRSDFPGDFVFGVSTSAPQIEGAASYENKGPSIWDEFNRKYQGKISDGSNLTIAIDSYKRFKEDVKAMRNLGVHAYRFSIPWTRILPNGSLEGGINQKAINHYNYLIDHLIKNGITPFVTILHFDWPAALEQKYGGFLDRSILDDYKDYADLCFEAFGDRVKNWMTINEPLIIAKFGYDMGVAVPGRCTDRNLCDAGNSAIEPYIATHNLLLAHATAVKLYRDKFLAKQRGQIGLVLVGQYYEPYSNSSADISAAKRAMDFEIGWFMEPLVFGDYPIAMKNIVKDRLPSFTNEEKELVKGSFDFVGINYYTARYAKDVPMDPGVPPIRFVADEHVGSSVDRNGVPIGPNAGGSSYLYVYPEGLQKLMKFVKQNYNNPTIYITENGYAEKRNKSMKIQEIYNDEARIEFILQHLYQTREALKQGVNVKGYFYWCLFDDFEWGEGYQVRFGLYYVDFEHGLNRIPKKSVKWYRNFVKGVGSQVI